MKKLPAECSDWQDSEWREEIIRDNDFSVHNVSIFPLKTPYEVMHLLTEAFM